MAEYYFPEFQNYIETLCTKHKDVLHDPANNRAFIRFQSDEDLQSIPNNASGTMVSLGDFTGKAIGEPDENKIRQTATLLFLVNAVSVEGDPYAGIAAAQVKAQDVMFQFYARMKKDYFDDDCGPLRYIEPEGMTYAPIDGPVLENSYGWQMNIPFKANAPAYNPLKWNE